MLCLLQLRHFHILLSGRPAISIGFSGPNVPNVSKMFQMFQIKRSKCSKCFKCSKLGEERKDDMQIGEAFHIFPRVSDGQDKTGQGPFIPVIRCHALSLSPVQPPGGAAAAGHQGVLLQSCPVRQAGWHTTNTIKWNQMKYVGWSHFVCGIA